VALGTGSKAGNYAITFNADNDALTITPRPVTVLADAKTKSQGTQDPELTYTVRPASPGQGLVSGESLSGSLEAVPIEGGRRKLITQGSLTQANNPNYAISFTDSVLTVEPANDALRAGQNSAHALAMSSGMGGLSGTNAGLAGASWGSTAAVSAADQGANTSPAGELVIVDVAGSALASGGDFSLAGALGQPGMASDDGASDNADTRSRKPLASLTVFAVDGGIRLPVFAASPHAQPLEESKN
jgi:hypothetical protein